ncbi:hypothetical protein IFM89_011531 [Coptis chinensis]|uniref:Uncharacterized protein n=1 Tax=Coptis chinensis TaxID=261450 RepID=A0A835M9E9_9MAGN|nr:hypothetical protein IFM89_011531 [Coptis chinensis]
MVVEASAEALDNFVGVERYNRPWKVVEQPPFMGEESHEFGLLAALGGFFRGFIFAAMFGMLSLLPAQPKHNTSPVTHSRTLTASNQNSLDSIVAEVISPLNGAVVSRVTPSTAMASVSTSSPLIAAVVSRESPSIAMESVSPPSSLYAAVVSRESPSTALATVRSPSSPSLPRSIQATSRNYEDFSSLQGPLLASPPISQLFRIPFEGSARNCLISNSPFSSLRNEGSPSTLSRDSAQNSGNARGNEVVVYTTMREQIQPVIEKEEGTLNEEELFRFNVDNNAYAALVMEEEGIDDDISKTHEDPFDDHIVTSPLVTRLQMLSQVVTRAQLQQQQQLQSLGKRGRGRDKGSGWDCNLISNLRKYFGASGSQLNRKLSCLTRMDRSSKMEMAMEGLFAMTWGLLLELFIAVGLKQTQDLGIEKLEVNSDFLGTINILNGIERCP